PGRAAGLAPPLSLWDLLPSSHGPGGGDRGAAHQEGPQLLAVARVSPVALLRARFQSRTSESPGMHILSPHCPTTIHPVCLRPRPGDEVVSPSCGSNFRLQESATPVAAPAGRRSLGRFELLEVVGQGAFGTVYKARDPGLDRVVAVKVPRAGNLAGAQELDRFLREARSAAQLRHPSIVSVHEVGLADGVPYLVSDFVQGVTLADLLSARRPG